MLNNYNNRKIEPAHTKGKSKKRNKRFHFPHLSVTVEAVTYDEALKKTKKL